MLIVVVERIAYSTRWLKKVDGPAGGDGADRCSPGRP